MYNRKDRRYRISINYQKKTYTIRVYEHGRVTAKYRSYPQGKDFSENWTEDDIKAFLRQSNDYYLVR